MPAKPPADDLATQLQKVVLKPIQPSPKAETGRPEEVPFADPPTKPEPPAAGDQPPLTRQTTHQRLIQFAQQRATAINIKAKKTALGTKPPGSDDEDESSSDDDSASDEDDDSD